MKSSDRAPKPSRTRSPLADHVGELDREIRSFPPTHAGTILQVGQGGRGFVVGDEDNRLIVTAAHCLRNIPQPQVPEDRFSSVLVGPLGSKPNVWVECRFADPIADIAVLGRPDGCDLFDELDAHDALLNGTVPFPVGRAPVEGLKLVRLFSIEGEWINCAARWFSGGLYIEGKGLKGGMSGSPILLEDGSAIGVFVTSQRDESQGGPNPVLSEHLPGWLLRLLLA